MSNKFQETVYDEKNDHICSAIIYLNYSVDDSLKTVMLKKYLANKI